MRIWFKDDPLSVNVGWKLSQGKFHFEKINHRLESLMEILKNVFRLIYISLPVFLLWIYKSSNKLMYFKKNIHWILFFTSVIVSSLFLSSRFLRPWVIITPILFYSVVKFIYEERSGTKKQDVFL